MIVVLEGLDNCGKNTIAKLLLERNPQFKAVDFPDYNSPIGRLIRTVITDEKFSPLSLQLLFSSERLSKKEKLLQLSKSGVVITTRYTYSAVAYGNAKGLNSQLLSILEEDMPKPTVKFFLKITPMESMRRSISNDIFESNLAFLQKVEREYSKIIQKEQDWHIIDAMRPIISVLQEVEQIIKDRIRIENE